MIVYKFGGASVKDAEAVRNLKYILSQNPGRKVVVVSAMGKMTNALEKVCYAYCNNRNYETELQFVKEFHYSICHKLFKDTNHEIFNILQSLFEELCVKLRKPPAKESSKDYSEIVAYGEIISTKIINSFLKSEQIKCEFLDVRNLIKTNYLYQEAKVDWKETEERIKAICNFSDTELYLTQGFIAANDNGVTTTLGREGSDFTAAIFAHCLDAESMTIWKDVPGVLNADPKWFSNKMKLENISYREAIELAYYGATIIHPKTIKPLQNKNIPLIVRSFLNISEEGTCIDQQTCNDSLIPSFIFRMDQVLISISPRDLSFIIEENLSDIFAMMARYHVSINLMQNSAVSFSVCVDNNPAILKKLTDELKKEYRVLFNSGLELATIRHYNQDTLDRVLHNKKIYLEQKTRHTARFVIQDKK
ncbi:MAG: aspartate kinase [Marinilabiliales bacterium]|nr:MAG: aspartate kinase [Marinilabiliales bacterium]